MAEELIGFPGFRLFGNGWSYLAKNTNYCGVLDQKKDILPQVKFGLAIENTSNEEGAITEKIFDFFFYGVVPIYSGTADINHYIPANCYIDYKSFSNTSELIQFVNSMQNDEYIAMQQNIYNFLCSVDFDQFSWRGYASAVYTALQSVELNNPKSLNYFTAFIMLTKLSPSFPLRYLLRRRTI